MPTYYFTSDVDEGMRMRGVGFNRTQLVWLSMGGSGRLLCFTQDHRLGFCPQ